MKTLVLLIVLLSASSSFAFSRLGVLVGYHSNVLDSNDPGTSYSRIGNPQYGAILMYSFLDMIALRTGVIIADRDSSFSTTVAGVDITGTQKLSYTEIPLDLQIWFSELYVFGGLKLGFQSSSKCEISSPANTACDSKTKGPNNMINLGIGYDLIDLGAFRIGIEAEYEKGSSNINDTPGSSTELRTSGLGFNAVATVGF
jgi:hypothetical protein